ncbi:MAG: EpsG family protein [Salinivirgaceae bacterium]|nr:EpsG family protein [Salinivirgaceae bacterium]
MLESALVYGSLTIIMVACGVFASRRQLAYNKGITMLGRKGNLGFAYLEIWLPIFFFTVVFGCRYDVGRDQLEYLKWYNEGVPESKEFLWRYMTDFLSNVGVHYAVYFSLWAFLQVFLIFYSIKEYRFLFPYVAYYLIVGNYFLAMMNTIRFSLVACIFFFATKYIEQKQFFKYCLCIVLAMLIHKTAIVLLIFYPLFVRKDVWISIKSQAIILGVSLFLMFNRDAAFGVVSNIFSFVIDRFNYGAGYGYILNPKYGVYLFNQAAEFGRNTGLGEYIFLFLGLIIMYYQSRMREKYDSKLFQISYVLWFMAFSLGFVAGKSFVLGRPLLYLANFKMLIIAYFTHYCFSSKKLNDKIIGIMFVLIYMALFINIISMGEVNKSAFTFFWQH